MRLWALVTSAFEDDEGFPLRGSPLLPPGRSVPGGVGGSGALLSGPSAPGSGPVPEGVGGVQAAGGLHHPPAPIRALGGGWGSFSGPSAPGDRPCTCW